MPSLPTPLPSKAGAHPEAVCWLHGHAQGNPSATHMGLL